MVAGVAAVLRLFLMNIYFRHPQCRGFGDTVPPTVVCGRTLWGRFRGRAAPSVLWGLPWKADPEGQKADSKLPDWGELRQSNCSRKWEFQASENLS